MKYLFAPVCLAALQELLLRRCLLAFDFDGTLAPIVREPNAAAMRFSTRALLVELARTQACVVVTGRSQADAALRLEGVPLRLIVGNHGVEPSVDEAYFAAATRTWLPGLRALAESIPGAFVEDKRLSLAIHYRQAADKRDARETLTTAARLLGARVVGGDNVINVVHPLAPHKGQALAEVARQLGYARALFVGDDETDEDAFAAAGLSVFGVRVGLSRASQAGYFIREQSEVDRLLALLLEMSTP